ncbi:putative transcription factor Trihelix family [Helianthus annuus]|nr:putative transcription factor Trihelix family [Helianthus annuus]
MNLMNRMEDEQSLGFMETKILNPSSSYFTFGKGETVNNNSNLNDHIMSDEDEPGFYGNNETCNRSKGRKGNLSSSRWQRMKWSDSRVRLLIQVVACVGDDDGVGDAGGGGGSSRKCLHKKGKWKTVSKIMVSKGCQVSPQQCEDKFNDLNKRYKRLNDILGRGVSCRVVENPALMETMPRLSSKMKEDVKKILNSKHLFYPEMCAYHNGQRIPNCTEELDLLQAREPLVAGQRGSKENVIHSVDEGGDHDESDDDDDDDDDENHDGEDQRVTGRNRFLDEMNEFFADPNNSKLQKKVWVEKRMLQLQEQRVGLETEGYEMEKRRFKWQRFCDKKDRELEVARLENERSMLENERTALQLKHKTQVVADSE